MKSLKIVMMKFQKCWGTNMSIENKIKILENEIKQFENGPDRNNVDKMVKLITELRRLRKEQYEETQRVNFDDDR